MFRARIQWLAGLVFVALVGACGSADGIPAVFDASARTSGTPHPGADASMSEPPFVLEDASLSEAGDGATDAVSDDSTSATDGDDSGASDAESADAMDGGSPSPADAALTPGCADGGTAGSSAGLPGWKGDWASGEYPSGDITAQNYLNIDGVPGQQGNVRQYKVHVPPGYDSTVPMPLLFCLHGLAQNPVMFCLDEGVGWNVKSDQEGFILVMPNGYQNSWNGGTCCGGAASAGLDDVALIRAIFFEVGKHVNVDLGRMYATGLSNGGYLSYRLACEASDLFAAVASGSGAIGTAAIGGGTMTTSDFAQCAPTHRVAVLDIHGTGDPIIPYSTQAPSLSVMASRDSCSATTAPAASPASGGDTTCVSYQGCSCQNVEVTGCSVQDGGHCWFGSSDCGTGAGPLGNAFVGNNSNFLKSTDAVWAFLSSFSR